MRFSYIALAVLALAALVSCQENEINYNTLEKGQVGFYLRGSATTKAGEPDVTTKGVTIDLGTDEFGHRFFLEQTITNLDAIGPETKATPAYTENVVDLYGGKFNSTVYSGSTVFDANGEFVYDESLGKYMHVYDNGLWDNSPVTFYMWMPGALNDAVGVSNLSFSEGKISFTYDGSKLTTAGAMTDLLFSSRSFKDNKGTAGDASSYNAKEGAEVLFHHALTGVKFASSNDEDEDAKFQITEVIFKGLKDKGNCVVTPQTENGGYKDVIDDYSSAKAVKWSNLSVSSEDAAYTSGEFSGLQDYKSGNFGSSFYEGGNTRNLNDKDATQTFWIIPQEMTDDVKVTIKYKVNYKKESDTADKWEEGEWDLDLGTYISKKAGTTVEMKAGELYTFYVRLDDVNVKIEDEVTATTKSNVVITNTGSVKAFIRASIIGQWLDNKENPVFGFVDNITNYEEVDSWYDDQFGDQEDDTQTIHHGTFVGLPGYRKGANPNAAGWLLCSDGFYYYTSIVEPGQPTGGALFTSYTVNDAFPKTVTIGSNTYPIHFLLEISTQAVSGVKQDGSEYEWQDAWARALGYTPAK